MGALKILSSISPNMMNFTSSIFQGGLNTSVLSSLFKTVQTSAVTDSWLGKVIGWVLSFLVDLIYTMGKWILYFVDVIFSYIQELAGLNIDLSSIEAATSPDSDMIFNLLYNGRHLTTTIVRSLLGLSVAVIIIFTIIALIKAQYDSVKAGQAADLASVTRRTLKSLVLLVITPLIAILGIVASDVLLVSLYNATNTSNSTSLGSKIFATSAVSANVYRLYAQEGLRVPITCDFSKQEEILEYYDGKEPTDKFTEYLTSTNNAIYTTYLTFNTAEFITYGSINSVLNPSEEVKGAENAYYTIYDKAIPSDYTSQKKDDDVEISSTFDKYRRIQNYQEEYFVMADVVDYAMESGAIMYFKTIQEVLDSIRDIDLNATEEDSYSIRNNLLYNIVNVYNIRFVEDDPGADPAEKEVVFDNTNYDNLLDYYTNGDWQAIRFLSNYFSVDESHNPISKMQIEYTHLRDTHDELVGAKYIMSHEKTYVFGGVSYTYFNPLVVGYSVEAGYEFSSDYIQRGQIISAKGVFYNAMYPTAIKKNDDRSEVIFYRDNIAEVAIGQSGALFNVDWVDDVSNGNFFSKIAIFFKALFNPSSLIPQMDLDPNAVQSTYTKETVTVNTLANGKMRIGYLMSSEFMSGLNDAMTGSIYGLNIENLFKVESLNFLILAMGGALLIRICFKAIFGLIGRAYDLYLIIIIYPTACASMPLDEGGYNNWFKNYLGKLLSTYGLILGINFVFMLFPVIESIEFFTQEAVGSSEIIQRVGSLFFALMPVSQITKLLNMAVVIMFELAAFTLLEEVPQVVARMTESRNLDEDNPINDTLQNISKTVSMVTKVIGGVGSVVKTAVATVKGGEGGLQDKLKAMGRAAVPGSELITAAKNKKYLNDKKREQKDAYKELQRSMKTAETADGSSDPKKKQEEVRKNLDAFLKAQSSYTSAISDPRTARKADAKKAREEAAKAGTASSKEDETEEDVAAQMEGMSGKELDQQVEDCDTMIRSLKQSKSGQSKAKKKEIDEEIKRLKARKKAAKEEKKSRKVGLFKNRKRKKAQKVIDKLKEKQAQGIPLTRREQKKLEESERIVKAVDKIETTERDYRERIRTKKEGEKAERQRREEEYIARNGTKGQKRRQQKRYEKREKKAMKALQNAGIDTSKIYGTGTDGQTILNEEYLSTLSKEQRDLVTAVYENTTQRKEQLSGITKSESQLREQRKTNPIGSTDFSANYYEIQIAAEKSTLDDIEKQIKELEEKKELTADDKKKLKALKNRKKTTEASITRYQEEQGNAELQKMFRNKAMRKRAVEFLMAQQEKNPMQEISEETIREYIRNIYASKHR